MQGNTSKESTLVQGNMSKESTLVQENTSKERTGNTGKSILVQGNTSKKSILVQGNTSKESTLVLLGYPLGAGPTPIGLRLNMECGFAKLLPSYKQSH